ncbi:MAG: flagellar protein FlaG [Colwellia polaris]|jgi:flagellar protein FlaG|uniref:flagellar protein FlaG n=1 Tax=Colwellia polaris TaxID=326537 RepID=UPI000A177573|nr:flagellar protein FlaG [Colwellia polaris]|tara:strand:- start:5138 stop:5566 length:429 start_codon:yes stop_codon:yes gene_type:complete
MILANTTDSSINANNSSTVELVNGNTERTTSENKSVDNLQKNATTIGTSIAEEQKSVSTSETNKAEKMTSEQLNKVAQQLQDFMGEMNRSLEFIVDEDSGRDVIKVLDKDTGDLIKQYPSEEVLSIISKLSNASGSLIDTEI